MGRTVREGRRHALVIGGSMAGLLAARALADHFQEVIVVEQDAFPPIVEHRRGVPQSRHTHGLLASGRQVLDRLFPGIYDELIEAGALPGDPVRDGRWFNEGACLYRCDSGLDGLLMSRPFLESMVRRRLLALPNVRSRENCRVEGLAASADQARITGIRAGGEVLEADLVVDATGRGSPSPRWLQALGYAAPEEDRVEVALSYTTRWFRRRPQDLDGDLVVVIPPTPEGKRGGVMLAQEGARWSVTLIGHFGISAPPELPGFIDFARSLHAPYIYEVIQRAEPLGEAAIARFPASVRRRYERLQRFPEGYLVFGDAISSFNPIYGQGMSVAALQATELAATLAEGGGELARRFFARAAKVVDIPWSIAAGNDLRIPEAVGPRTPAIRFINWYMARLHKAGHHDPLVSVAFHRVANLLAPPPSVMHPRIAWRVLWGNLRRTASAHAAAESLRAAAGGDAQG
jgi:2-polyprenyl-6-methoxyphenol hydroxylase-like FAD-dependent oxidoreductase